MKTLVEQRSEAAKKIQDIIGVAETEQRALTVDERSSYDAALKAIEDIDETTKRQKASKSLEDLEERVITDVPGKEVKDEQRSAFRNFLTGKISGFEPKEERAMTSGTGETGGYLIPEKYASQLREVATANSVVRQLATIDKWDADGAYPVLTGFGTTHLVGENPDADVDETTPSFDQKKISGYQLMYLVDIPKTMLAKEVYGVEAKLPGWWGNSLAVKEENLFINGDGNSKPLGLLAAATAGQATAANNAITGDDIIAWFYKCKAKYRKAASWIFADSTVKMIRQIKNPVTTSGALQYLWVPGLGDAPDTLMGRPIGVSDEMPAFAAGAKIGVFGDIKQYIIAEFGVPSMLRDPYSRAARAQVRFIGWEMVDATLPIAEAIVTCPILA